MAYGEMSGMRWPERMSSCRRLLVVVLLLLVLQRVEPDGSGGASAYSLPNKLILSPNLKMRPASSLLFCYHGDRGGVEGWPSSSFRSRSWCRSSLLASSGLGLSASSSLDAPWRIVQGTARSGVSFFVRLAAAGGGSVFSLSWLNICCCSSTTTYTCASWVVLALLNIEDGAGRNLVPLQIFGLISLGNQRQVYMHKRKWVSDAWLGVNFNNLSATHCCGGRWRIKDASHAMDFGIVVFVTLRCLGATMEVGWRLERISTVNLCIAVGVQFLFLQTKLGCTPKHEQVFILSSRCTGFLFADDRLVEDIAPLFGCVTRGG